ASTLKSPSYTKSVSWQHYLVRVVTIFATELVAIFNQAEKLSQYIESGSWRA
ncbi:transposase, partial [Shigella flexneri]